LAFPLKHSVSPRTGSITLRYFLFLNTVFKVIHIVKDQGIVIP
jgi:hypothetical protein